MNAPFPSGASGGCCSAAAGKVGTEGPAAAGNWHGLGPLLAVTPPREGATPPFPAFEGANKASGMAAARAGASGDWCDLTAARSSR